MKKGKVKLHFGWILPKMTREFISGGSLQQLAPLPPWKEGHHLKIETSLTFWICKQLWCVPQNPGPPRSTLKMHKNNDVRNPFDFFSSPSIWIHSSADHLLPVPRIMMVARFNLYAQSLIQLCAKVHFFFNGRHEFFIHEPKTRWWWFQSFLFSHNDPIWLYSIF